MGLVNRPNDISLLVQELAKIYLTWKLQRQWLLGDVPVSYLIAETFVLSVASGG